MNKYIQEAELCPKYIDHKEIGKKQQLFSFHEEGPGFPFYLPKGMVFKNLLINYWRKEHHKRGYQEIESPMMLNKNLWEKSGHWDLYKENMYISEIEKGELAIKPMNCPGAILVYKEKKRNVKEFPLRLCELGKVHRKENSGSLSGLFRVRSFVVDDAHIFCEKNDLKKEVKDILNLCHKILNECGFESLEYELSVRSEEKKLKYLGSCNDWEIAEKILKESLEEMNLPYKRMEGEAKFYGPALEIKLKDSIGRSWQCSSIQLDFNLPQRFSLVYYDENGKKQVPYMLHRCIFGSLERFIAILLEHHEGKLPSWLCPVQVRVISIGKRDEEFIKLIEEYLKNKKIRYEVDNSLKSLSEKLKKLKGEAIPLSIIIGEKEEKLRKVSLRYLNGEVKNLVDLDDIFVLNNDQNHS